MNFLVPTSCLCITLRERREMHVIRDKSKWKDSVKGRKYVLLLRLKKVFKLNGILKRNYFMFSLHEFDSSLWSQCHY